MLRKGFLFFVVYFLAMQVIQSQTHPVGGFVVRDTFGIWDSKISGLSEGRKISEWKVTYQDYLKILELDPVDAKPSEAGEQKAEILNKYYCNSIELYPESGKFIDPNNLFNVVIDSIKYNFVFPSLEYSIEVQSFKEGIHIVKSKEILTTDRFGGTINIAVYKDSNLIKNYEDKNCLTKKEIKDLFKSNFNWIRITINGNYNDKISMDIHLKL